MNEKHKTPNFNFTFSIPELNLYIPFNGYSSSLHKFIKTWLALKKSREVILSYPEFLERIMHQYNKGYFINIGIKGVTELVNYLVLKYDIRRKDKPEEEVSTNYLRSKIYHYHDPENNS